MTILLLAEHDGSSVSDQTAKAATAAAAIGGDIHVLVAGKGCAAAAEDAAKIAGVSKVLIVESDALAEALAEPLAATILDLASGYDVIMAAATAIGKNVMPRVAAAGILLGLAHPQHLLVLGQRPGPAVSGGAAGAAAPQTAAGTGSAAVVCVHSSFL